MKQILLATIIGLLGATSAYAETIIERFPPAGYLPEGVIIGSWAVFPTNMNTYGQTVTVQTSGRLMRFDLLMNRPAPPNWVASTSPYRLQLAAGVNGSNLAGQDFFLPADLHETMQWVSVDLSGQNMMVAAGDQLFATVEASDPTYPYAFWHSFAGPSQFLYGGGAAFERTPCPASPYNPRCGQWEQLSSDGAEVDFGYRLHIDTGLVAVPEPATWGMMILGFGMVSASMRYRRRSTKAVCA